ncbi:MAG: glycosyltransferase [Polyangiaceae bacterium]|jgi:dolichyl-phosphate beta-glucosyltransferase
MRQDSSASPTRPTRLVSIVVPTLKEDEIGVALGRVGEYLARIEGYDFEVLLADDSPEPYKTLMDAATAAFDARFGSKVTAKRVDGPRKGKGAALRVGVVASRGDFVFWMDADLPVPLENIERFLRIFDDERADLVVAERPFDRNLSQPVRFIASRALFAFQRALVFQSRAFDDTQCGFKAFRGELVRRIAGQQIVDGGMADIEYLYAAVQSGAHAVRVSVTPNPETRESKINVKKALMQDPVDILRIKLRGLTGGYSSTRPASRR